MSVVAEQPLATMGAPLCDVDHEPFIDQRPAVAVQTKTQIVDDDAIIDSGTYDWQHVVEESASVWGSVWMSTQFPSPLMRKHQ